MNYIFKEKISGFTILYAVLVSSLLLSISVSIYSISSKQYLLSSSSIDSQIAIYAADAGIECALYWDSKDGFKAPPEDGITHDGLAMMYCNNDLLNPVIDDQGNVVITTIQTDFNLTGGIPTTTPVPGDDMQCAKVKITKEYMESDPTVVKTTIVSSGYNYCDTNPRRVERALRVTYPVDPGAGI